jgi:type I restriction enzyme S subunit
MGINDLNTEGAVSPVYEVFKAKENYHYWVLMLLKHPNIKRGIEGLCSGTVRQNLKFSDLASLNIKIPDAKAVALFNVEYEKLKKRHDHNVQQNETLIALRDGLLPKLMTGKITL